MDTLWEVLADSEEDKLSESLSDSEVDILSEVLSLMDCDVEVLFETLWLSESEAYSLLSGGSSVLTYT